eukprot:3887624-Prymnesium_polylepis.1
MPVDSIGLPPLIPTTATEGAIATEGPIATEGAIATESTIGNDAALEPVSGTAVKAKRSWTAPEDEKLLEVVKRLGATSWSLVAAE